MLVAETTLRALFSEYTRYRLRGAREKTRQKFGYALDHWARLLGREPTVADLTEDGILDWLWWMRESVDISIATCNAYGAKIRALWTFAARRGYVSRWPEFQLLPDDARVPVAFSRSEIHRLYAAITATRGDVGEIPANRWWQSLCLSLWDTAERINAMLSARWCDLVDGRLMIRAENRKGRAGHRRPAVYRLHDDTLQAIEAIRSPRELIWPWPLQRSMLWYRWKNILRAAGISADRYHGFHAIRRTVASNAQAGGMDASDILDHRDRRSTEAYISPHIVTRPAPIDVLYRPGT